MRASTLASEGIEILNDAGLASMGGPNHVPSPAGLKAALKTAVAVSLHQQGDRAKALLHFDRVATEFGELMDSNDAAVASFLSDYLVMLVAFQDQHKLVEVGRYFSQRVSSPDDSSELSPLWLPTAMASQTPRMLLDLARSLRRGHDAVRAFDSCLYSANLGIVMADRATAAEAIEDALQILPNSVAALHLRGFLRWEAAKYDEASNDFTAVLEANPLYLAPRVALADACLKMGRIGAAAAALDRVLLHRPESMNDQLLRAEAHRLNGLLAQMQEDDGKARESWKSAMNFLNQVLEQESGMADALRSRALVHYCQKDLPSSLDDLTSSLLYAPNHVAANGWMAVVLLDLEDYPEALAAANLSIELLGSDPSIATLKPWLLVLKGRALLETKSTIQAIETLAEAVEFNPADWEVAAQLMRAQELVRTQERRKDIEAVAKRACDLQKDLYPEEFLRDLRFKEVDAFRALGNYVEAFDAFNREPTPARNHSTVWRHARLLADIGNFEAAGELLGRGRLAEWWDVDQLSLRGWVVQNLEPATAKLRAELAVEGCWLYETALKTLGESQRESFDAVWIKKGLANASLRVGREEDARQNYLAVIDGCERLMRQSEYSARATALMGWCYHCIKEYKLALRYYQVASASGEPSIAGAFDRALVLLASGDESGSGSGPAAFASYAAALERANSLEPLRRIGVCRVALHDLRELLFRVPAIAEATKIIDLLAAKLLRDVAGIEGEYDGLADHMYTFLEVVKLPPSGRPAEESQAATAPETALTLSLEPASSEASPVALGKSAIQCERSGDLQGSQEAAREALRSGLYVEDPAGARSLVALVTRNAARGICAPEEYENVIQDAFSKVGPERAYLDLLKIERQLSAKEKHLWFETVVKLFYHSHDDDSIYLSEADGKRAVPSTPSLVVKLYPYLPPSIWDANEMGF